MKISIQNSRVFQQCGGIDPAETFLNPSLQMLLLIKMKRPGYEAHSLKERISVSVFTKGPAAIKTHCVLLSHREGCIMGCRDPESVVCGRATKHLPTIWPLVLEGFCLGVVSTELNRESILFSLSVCVGPPGLALPHTAWGAVSCCPDERQAFCGWAHSS